MLDRIIIVGFLVILVFMAMAMGTVEAWSIALFEFATIGLVLLWLLKALKERELAIQFPAPAVPLAGLLLLGLFQGVAFSRSGGVRFSLSRDVEATRMAVTVIFFLFVLFIIAANFFGTNERLRALGVFLTAYGLAMAVLALIQQFTWEGKLLWLRPVRTATGLAGPFVNRNHFSGYMEMLAPIALALALNQGGKGELRLLYGFTAVIMGISVAASLSRGGMLALTAGLLFLAFAAAFSKRGGRRRTTLSMLAQPLAFALLIGGSIFAGIFWVGADLGIAERVAGGTAGPTPTQRYAIWTDSLKLIAANPVAGVGLGAFETAFPKYGSGDGSQIVDFVHNDYLQVVTDAGLIGGAIAAWFLVLMSRSFARAVRSSDPHLQALALGFGSGIFALLVHSLFDFNLQIPSNALLFLLLCAALSRLSSLVEGVGHA